MDESKSKNEKYLGSVGLAPPQRYRWAEAHPT